MGSIAIFTLWVANAFAATYPISAPGGDGPLPGFLDTLRLKPGDSVLFHRGQTFRGQLAIRHSGTMEAPIVYGAFGTGAPPFLSGSIPLTQWKSSGGRTFVYPCTAAVRQLFSHGHPELLARHPNRGYMTIDSVLDERTFIAKSLRPDTGWTGASVHVRSERWSLDFRRVENSGPGGLIRLDRPPNYPLTAGWGFFLNNHILALDSAGEWLWDSAGKAVFYLPPGGRPPHFGVEGSVSQGLEARGQSHFVVQDLRFAHSTGPAISGMELTVATFLRLEIFNPGEDGIRLRGRDLRVEQCRIRGAVTRGIYGEMAVGRIRDNRVSVTGAWYRLGLGGFQGECCRGSGIEVYGDSNAITDNFVDSTGHNGIWFQGVSDSIARNTVRHWAMTLDDNGAIYSWAKDSGDPGSHGSVIVRNHIGSGIGAPGGTPGSLRAAFGIYLDNYVHGIQVRDNIVFEGDIGIYVHDSRDNILEGNRLFDNRGGQIVLKRDWLTETVMSGNLVRGNTMVAATGQSACVSENVRTENPTPVAGYEENICVTRDSKAWIPMRSTVKMWRKSRPSAKGWTAD